MQYWNEIRTFTASQGGYGTESGFPPCFRPGLIPRTNQYAVSNSDQKLRGGEEITFHAD